MDLHHHRMRQEVIWDLIIMEIHMNIHNLLKKDDIIKYFSLRLLAFSLLSPVCMYVNLEFCFLYYFILMYLNKLISSLITILKGHFYCLRDNTTEGKLPFFSVL